MLSHYKIIEWITIACIIVLVGGLVYRFGRSLWQPIVFKLRGRYTVADRIRQIEPAAVSRLLPLVNAAGLTLPVKELTYIGLKEEQQLEVWGSRGDAWSLIKTYPFTAFSGTLGPKLREGDRQIPEGVYAVEFLNPNSRYYLSIKVGYPNAFDRQMACRDERTQLGGDIFIHGKSVTIGCIPLGDSGIEELFYLTAQTGIEHVTVILAPYDMRTQQKVLQIPNIDWENALYQRLADALMKYQKI